MKEKIKYLIGKKSFHICMIIIIIAIILFTLGIIMLKYSVEGETNMPFNLKQVTIISSSIGKDKEPGENKWAFNIDQNNDIYLYIEKNKKYGKEEAIRSILIDNIQVQKQIEKGTISLYRPNTLEEGGTFKNSQENKVENIEYLGALETDLKNLKVSNQGGIIVFRYANENLAEYVSNDDEINHNELLKKSGIKEEELKAKINFDVTIKTENDKEFKAKLSFDLPVSGILESGTTSQEITDLKDIIFKRTKN